MGSVRKCTERYRNSKNQKEMLKLKKISWVHQSPELARESANVTLTTEFFMPRFWQASWRHTMCHCPCGCICFCPLKGTLAQLRHDVTGRKVRGQRGWYLQELFKARIIESMACTEKKFYLS